MESALIDTRSGHMFKCASLRRNARHALTCHGVQSFKAGNIAIIQGVVYLALECVLWPVGSNGQIRLFASRVVARTVLESSA